MVGESDSVVANDSVRSDSFRRGESPSRIHTTQSTPEYLVEVVVAEAVVVAVIAAAVAATVADVTALNFFTNAGDR